MLFTHQWFVIVGIGGGDGGGFWFVCLETGSCYITLAGLEFSKSSRLAWNLWWFRLRRRYTLLIEYAIIVCTNKDADRVELQCRERWTITNTGFYIWFFLNSCMFEEVQKKHTRFHFLKPTEDRLLVSPYIWELLGVRSEGRACHTRLFS